MCIIMIKPKNVKLPKREVLQNCFDNNPDGAGYMYPDKGRVVIKKGYMRFNDLYSDLIKDSSEEKTVIVHFRIGTSGGNTRENTHPFPVDGRTENLRKTYQTARLGVAHNGMIDIRVPDKNLSDTMYYIETRLALMDKISHNFYRNKFFLSLIKNEIGGDRMAFLDAQGHYEKVGSWIFDNGCYYSNGTYKDTRFSRFSWYDMDDYLPGTQSHNAKTKKHINSNKNINKALSFEVMCLTDAHIVVDMETGETITGQGFCIDEGLNVYETLYTCDGVLVVEPMYYSEAYTQDFTQLSFDYDTDMLAVDALDV